MRSPSCVSVCVGIPIVARQRLSKHVLAATNEHPTTEELFDAVLSVLCLSYLILTMWYKKSRQLHWFRPSGG
jgi:hypothetical protein